MNTNLNLKIGNFNNLKIAKQTAYGLYLDGLDQGNILLPIRYQPKIFKIGDVLEVFIYLDSDDTLIATTQTPKAKVGQCAFLEVKDVNNVGAFLDWGLAKDLLVPYSEQHRPMEVGKSYLVYVFLDESTDRIAASSKIDYYLDEESDNFKAKQKVELTIWMQSDLGYKAIIDNTHIGLIYKSEIFQAIKNGQKLTGFIKNIRDDKRIDLTLQLQNKFAQDELSQKIIDYLKANNNTCFLTDKSPPDAIYKAFNVSKKQYKKALGGLYKQKIILIEAQKITLLEDN